MTDEPAPSVPGGELALTNAPPQTINAIEDEAAQVLNHAHQEHERERAELLRLITEPRRPYPRPA
ncbi:hypothetical protein [Streptomyces sp. NPDC052811]|uniref:hypothetical protein n=1 Tax=Streptomyces sp. NPDC052811 TaxID=3155731 RepID=UPI00342BD885